MAFPTPTSIGETYFDQSSGRKWICSSLNPVVWSVDKSATLLIGAAGLSSSGFSQFGNGVKISGGLTAIGNVAISGNLTVGGAVITTLSEVVQIEDNIIQLNSNATVGASGGIEMYRGVNGSRYILWDEDLDKWRFTNDGVNYVDLGAALSLPIATASITGVAAFPNADFSVSPFGVVSLTGNVARTIIGQTFTGLQVFSSGLSANGLTGTLMTSSQPNITAVGVLNGLSVNNGLSVTGGIAGTLVTPAQTNITAVGTLASLNTAGLTSSQRVNITNGGLSAAGPVFIQSDGLSVTGGIAGIIVTPSQTNITSVGSLLSLNTAGITSTQRVNVSAGGIVVQAGGLSVTGGANMTGGAVIAGGLTSLGQIFVVAGQTANFFGSIVVSGNNIGIPDLTYETNAGITWPSSSVPTYTLGDRWTNGANEYTWVGNAWVEINNAVSSAPFDTIPDGSVTPAKLSSGGPSWSSSTKYLTVNNSTITVTGSAPSYTTRAWASFDSVGTIFNSGNVSSVTNPSSGNFTINFSTPMTTTGYAISAILTSAGNARAQIVQLASTPLTGSFGIFEGQVQDNTLLSLFQSSRTTVTVVA